MSETEQANMFLDVDNVIDKFNNWLKAQTEKSSVAESDEGLD